MRKNQFKLRVGKYQILVETPHNLHTLIKKWGKGVVLTSTFVGGEIYMDALSFDGMAMLTTIGFSDLLRTFTCNPN